MARARRSSVDGGSASLAFEAGESVSASLGESKECSSTIIQER